MSERLPSDIAPSGFADSEMARLLLRRLKMRASLQDAQRSVAALLNLLDQSAKTHGGQCPATGSGGVYLSACDQQGGVEGLGLVEIECDGQREQELLLGVDLFIQFLDRIDAGLRQGLFGVDHAGESIQQIDPAHRLSGGAK